MGPAKISFADPTVWREAHDTRTGGPPMDAAGIQRWINLQHIPTYYDDFVATALNEIIQEHQGLTEAALAVTGVKHLGKSDAVTAVLLERAMTSGRWQRRALDGHNQVPFVFVEAPERATSKAIMKAACRFLGLDAKGDLDDLRARLSRAAPLMGVQALVVDESQNFRRRSASATTITDGLRGLLHLSVPTVFVGIDLENSALLRTFNEPGDSVEQIIERTNVLRMLPARGKRVAEVARAVKAFDQRLSLIEDFNAPALRSNDVLQTVLRETDGRVGAMLERIKKAAAAAILTDRCLDDAKLLAKSTSAGRVTVAA